MPIRFYLFLSLLVLLAGGCAKDTYGTWKAPLVYRIDIQQGNVVDQSMVNKLRRGMDKNQVKFIMGTPLLVDPFHSNRWEYLYSMEPGRGEREQRHITLHFKDDKLDNITGDIIVSTNPTEEDPLDKDRVVVVPIEDHEEGFFSKIWGSDEEEIKETGETPGLVTEESPQEQADTVSTPDVTETETATLESEADKEDQITADVDTQPETEVETETKTEEKEPDVEKDKNLVRRFWDRITGSEEDSTRESPETKRDRRDAEVFETTGGEL